MSNFIHTFKLGQSGHNKGLTTGIPKLDLAINGIQKKQTITLSAAPKVGKTTLGDYAFLLSPYLEAIKEDTLDNIEWIYFSLEIDRIDKEFKFAVFFMAIDYEIYTYTYKGKTYNINKDYLTGTQLHVNDDGSTETIKIQSDHEEILKLIYKNRIIPLFGEYDINGKLIKKGKIMFIEKRLTPLEIERFLYSKLEELGSFNENKTVFNFKNPLQRIIVFCDHVRKLKREAKSTIKDTIDKYYEITTEIRNLTQITFINILHNNRGLANIDRLKLAGNYIFPTSDDGKDSGNPAEESTIYMTLFNPNDEKYGLTEHFNLKLEDYPNYRSLHITESRNGDCPVHIQLNMYANLNIFTQINR